MKMTTEFYLEHLMFTLGTLLVTLALSYLIKKVIDLFFKGVKNRISSESTIARTRTVRNLLKNVLDVVLFLMSILIILSNWGINIIPILTGASILGLAVSFGAQTFIKDVIAGFFIILEDQYHIGDHIKVSTFDGEVYNISLRLTVLRDKRGNFIYIPNSQIINVVRYIKKA